MKDKDILEAEVKQLTKEIKIQLERVARLQRRIASASAPKSLKDIIGHSGPEITSAEFTKANREMFNMLHRATGANQYERKAENIKRELEDATILLKSGRKAFVRYTGKDRYKLYPAR